MSRTETVGEIADALAALNCAVDGETYGLRLRQHGDGCVTRSTLTCGRADAVAFGPDQSIVAVLRSMAPPPMSQYDALKILGKAAESQNDAFRRALDVLRKAVNP